MGEFFDVVHKAIQFPLGVDFLLSAQGESVELFVVADIAEDGFDGGEALAVLASAFFAVDGAFHFVGITFLACVCLASVEGDLAYLGLVGGAQAFFSLVAGHAVA